MPERTLVLYMKLTTLEPYSRPYVSLYELTDFHKNEWVTVYSNKKMDGIMDRLNIQGYGWSASLQWKSWLIKQASKEIFDAYLPIFELLSQVKE